MEFVYNAILVLHFVGLASLLGGFIVQIKSPEKGVNAAMFHGAITQLVTGLLLVGLPEMGLASPYEGWESWDHTKIAVKLILSLVVLVLTFIGRKKPLPQVGLWGAIGGLTLLSVIVAVFWQ